MRRFFDDDGMNFAVLLAIGAAYAGLADVGEVLATIERIPDGDTEAWVREWAGTAERLVVEADSSERRGHRASTRSRLLRACTYYDHASSFAAGSSDPSRFSGLWERHRDCWDRAARLFATPVEQIEVPYAGTTLAGYFFRPAGSDEPRKTIILNNGSDGPVSSMWSMGGRAAVERGWNAVAFDGPGQGAALHRQHLYFRHDWERVIVPVIDYLCTRSDVDTGKIALQGVSQGGYWAPRAAAFEPRVAALVADPGVVRVAASWEGHLPEEMSDLLDDDAAKEAFDSIMAGAQPEQKAVMAWRMAPYGTTSAFEAFRAARRMSLDDDTIGRIRCPTLVLDPDNEQFWPGQSNQLYAALACPKRLVRFTDEEGAGFHCEPAAQSLRDERVFDFLDEVFG